MAVPWSASRASFVFCVVALLGCGGHFEAVDAVGKTGQGLAQHGATFRTSVGVCELGASLLPPAGASTLGVACKEREAQARRWEVIVKALVAYASKLSALATQSDVSTGDAVKAAMGAMSEAEWTSLGSDQVAATAGLADAITKALSAQYRAHVLDETVESVDPPLQTVLHALVGEVDLRIHDIDLVAKQVSDARVVLGSAPPTNPAGQVPASWGPGLFLSREYLRDARVRYGALKMAVEAFAKAHASLRKNVGKLDTKEAMAEVIAVVKAAYSAKNAFTATP